MSSTMVAPDPAPEPAPKPSAKPEEHKSLWGHIADVADFLFATKSLGRLVTGHGSWGDLATAGITAASFFIPPVRLLKFGIKPLESIIVHAAEVAASDTASVAAKNAATRTAENARYLIDNPDKHKELLQVINTTDNPEALKLNHLSSEADHFLSTGTVPTKEPVIKGLGKSMPRRPEEVGPQFIQADNGISRSLYEEGETKVHPDAAQPDTFLEDTALSSDEMRMGTQYPKYPNLTQTVVDNLRTKGHGEDYIKAYDEYIGKLDKGELVDEDKIRQFKFNSKRSEDEYLFEEGQDINLKGQKLDWAVQHQASMDENGNLVLTELENAGDKIKPLSTAEFMGIVPTPKRLNSAARSYPSEIRADVGNSASNWLNAKMFGTSEQIAKAERLYNADKDALRKALNSSKITPHAAMAIKKEQQKDLVDKIFKSVIPEFKPKNPYARSASKRLKPTSEVDPRITQDVAKKVTVFDRITHVENILKREQIDFLPESKQYQKLIKSNYDLNNPKELAEYNDIIKNYKDELVNLKELQVKHVESVQSFVKDLDDNGIKYFVRMLNGKPLKELESLDHHVYINLLRDIFRQAKADDVKRSVATLGKRFKSLQDDALKQQNKLEMEKRLSRNAPLVKNNTSLDRNEETLAKVQAMAKPEPKEPEVVAETLSKEERLAATKAKVEALAKTKPVEVVEKKTVEPINDIVVHSGGASGSDTAWAKAADEAGIVTKGHSFVGHDKLSPGSAGFTGTRPELEERIIYTKEEINKAKPFIEKAARNLGVRPSDNNLVLRNYYQVKDSDAVIAIVERLSANKKTTSSGTRWGMQMGIDKGIPVHVFDQSVSKWFKWNGTVFEEAGLPPKFKSFAGIGTRDLKESGRKAIKDYIESLVKGK